MAGIKRAREPPQERPERHLPASRQGRDEQAYAVKRDAQQQREYGVQFWPPPRGKVGRIARAIAGTNSGRSNRGS